MKLLRLSNQYYFIGLLIASIIGGIVAYFIIEHNINEEFNEKLFAEKEQLIYELNRYDELLSTYRLNIGDKINITKVNSDPKIQPFIKDTIVYSTYDKKNLNHRQLFFSETIKDNAYIISITKPLLSQENLIKDAFEIIIVIIVLFFLTMIVLANVVSKIVWKPFYNTMRQLRQYNIKTAKSITFQSTKVSEFHELNTTIERMTTQVEKDYQLLKEYTENASHEIQTPLAIIKNKIELLMQDQGLNQTQLLTLNQIYESTGRLSKLNKNLSILTKIDNNQFIETSLIDVSSYIKQQLEAFDELLQLKEISVVTRFKNHPKLHLNETLAYLLFTNLISNAIKHNSHGGEINIDVTETSFTISNSGPPLAIDKDKLFNRFIKSPHNPDSTGLGLSMVHKIVSHYKHVISYDYNDNLHVINLVF